ncbi:MAG: cytochrome ubiquinol oxidase subunit I [Capsulimonadaceae bacterium]
MSDAVIAGRAQFAFTVMFHYLFPALTMGLGTLIAILKTLQLTRGDERFGVAARFWTRVFALNFAMGVISGIPMEFQFGTNWSHFSDAAGGIIGQPLAMEGIYAFFLESGFLGILLFGEKRISPFLHWLASVLVAVGTLISGYFIVVTDAWMQHPVGYRMTSDGKFVLTSLKAVLLNPYACWQYLHTINGAIVTGAMVMAGVGAYYLLARRDEEFGRICVKLGVVVGLVFAVTQLFPTGARHGENIARFQPVKMAAMEGQFATQSGAPLAIIGMPDSKTGTLLDAIKVPQLLSYLAYGDTRKVVLGLNDTPASLRPPVEVVYYAYHIMVGLGTIFIAVLALGALMLWRNKIYSARWFLWILMFSMPFPYIANEAGWTVAEVGRQPWLVYGLMATPAGISTTVSSGETVFTLLGFAGMYALLGLVFLHLLIKTIGEGPSGGHDGHPESAPELAEVTK